MKLVFDELALADLEDIHSWIAQDSPRTAKTVVQRVLASIEQLTTSPYMGRPGRDEGTREWVVPRLPYIVVYEVDAARDEMVVIAVFHGARDWEPALRDRR